MDENKGQVHDSGLDNAASGGKDCGNRPEEKCFREER